MTNTPVMAWKTIKIYGWDVSFERDSPWYVKHKKIYGFSSIDRIDIDDIKTAYKETDLASNYIGKVTTIYPATNGLKRCKRKRCYTFKVNVSNFDPKKLQLHYVSVVIKINKEEVDTNNRIIDKITYNGRICKLIWESNDSQDFQTIIWHKSPFIYDWCGIPSEGLVKASLNGWHGYINTYGGVNIPFQFHDAHDFREGMAAVQSSNHLWGFIDKTGKEIITCEYEDVHDFKDGLAFFQGDDEWIHGFIDKKGETVIPCIFPNFSDGVGCEHHDFNCGVAVACDKLCYFGYIDKKGEVVTPMIYSYSEPFSEGLGAVRKNGKWGFVNAVGETIIPLIYSKVKSFSEGLAAVKINDNWGYIDKSNNMVVPCIFDSAYNFRDGLAIIEINGKVGFIDKSGKYVIDCEYDDAQNFNNGLAPVKKNKKWGFINLNGTLSIPFNYDNAEPFNKNRLACVKLKGKWGCIDKQGHVVVPFVYDCIGNYEEVLIVELCEKEGLLDIKGNPIEDNAIYKSLSRKYDQVFVNNGDIRTYSIALDGKYGLVDAEGNEVIPPRYDWLGEGFYNGLLLAGYVIEGKRTAGFINLKGEEVIVQREWRVTNFKNGVALASYDGKKWGVINKKGDTIIPFEHKEGLLCIEEDKILVIDYNGNENPQIYDFKGNIINAL